MLRRGTGDPRALSSAEYETQSHDLPIHRTPPVRGLLKLLQGQISDESEPLVAVYRYHGPTLRESQKELKKKRTATSQKHNKGDESPLLIPKHSMDFKTIVRRHKFVAFFVVQGFRNVGGNTYYSAHTLNLRRILATDYHDVMTTFVLDLGGSSNNSAAAIGFGDEETGGGGSSDEASSLFCNGTGFSQFPTDGVSISTLLALLNVSKIPAVVVLDAFTGRIKVGDAILSIERNDSHTVVNRWQSGRSGLSILQQLGAVATCDCSHGPCCSGSGGGCCVVQ